MPTPGGSTIAVPGLHSGELKRVKNHLVKKSHFKCLVFPFWEMTKILYFIMFCGVYNVLYTMFCRTQRVLTGF